MLSARKAEQAAAAEKQRGQLEKAMLDLQERHNKVIYSRVACPKFGHPVQSSDIYLSSQSLNFNLADYRSSYHYTAPLYVYNLVLTSSQQLDDAD